MAGPGAEARRSGIVWEAVGAGAARGLLLIVPVVAVQLLTTRRYTDDPPPALIALFFVCVLTAFAAAGSRAGRDAQHAPRAHGAFAGVFALLAWLPLRLLVAAVGDGDNALTGIGPAFVFAVGMGALGGVWGAYRTRATGGPG